MTKIFKLFSICSILIISSSIFAEEPLTVEEQMASLESMCAQTSAERNERHAEKSLYERLGGYENILKLTTEIVRLHLQNETIIPMLKNVDTGLLAKHVADFVAAGTGGTAIYTGRNLPASHAHLKLTDADFLSAGGDITNAMQNLGYGQEEIDEFVCILVSLKDQVVLKKSDQGTDTKD